MWEPPVLILFFFFCWWITFISVLGRSKCQWGDRLKGNVTSDWVPWRLWTGNDSSEAKHTWILYLGRLRKTMKSYCLTSCMILKASFWFHGLPFPDPYSPPKWEQICMRCSIIWFVWFSLPYILCEPSHCGLCMMVNGLLLWMSWNTMAFSRKWLKQAEIFMVCEFSHCLLRHDINHNWLSLSNTLGHKP